MIGLPPSPAELAAFEEHGYEATVDTLLQSERFGEKWARHWLDVARYCDTNGYEKDLKREQWKWRDWVVEAFNSNMPFDQFTLEQFAGDLLPNATPEQKLATCFHRNHMTNGEGGRDPEESRVDYVLGKLAGGIAHDFNNMLTAINGYGELLLPSVQDRPDLAESVGEILKAGRRAAALTHQLLAYSRRQIMTLKAMDLNAAVTNMTGMLQRLIPENIRTEFRLGTDLPPILADMSQVEQIILNLMLNARDALPAGGNIRLSTSHVLLRPEDAIRYLQNTVDLAPGTTPQVESFPNWLPNLPILPLRIKLMVVNL